MGLTIPSTTTNKNDDGIYTWEKTLKDVNNVDELFSNARDMGFLRLNYSRISTVAQLSKQDSVDVYKVQVQSRGKFSLSLRTGDAEEESVLDLSSYQQKLDELQAITDPEGWAAKQKEENEKYLNQNLIEINAPGIKVEVYMKQNGREVLVGDSHASSGSKMRENMDKMLSGEYRATQGEYYVKITRDDNTKNTKEVPYAMQVRLGKTYIHDYILKEAPSDDTKNNRESKVPSFGSGSSLSTLNVLQIQASKYTETANMLSTGYLNMADIYSKNSKY